MTHLLDNQCRRCGELHDEAWQLIDASERWAITTTHCECGHSWTVVHTAPVNWKAVRTWIARGCVPEEGPAAVVRSMPWQKYRLEGVTLALESAAS